MLHRYFRSLWGQMSPEGRRTFSHDLVRGGVDGALLTLQLTFGLLVAIEYFDASVVQKSLIAGAHAMGLLCSLPYAAWSPILGKKKKCARLCRCSLPGLVSCWPLQPLQRRYTPLAWSSSA